MTAHAKTPSSAPGLQARKTGAAILLILLAVMVFAPTVAYPVFLMKLMCFALFAAAFNLLLGFTGMLSFGHAAFFGGAAYATAHSIKVWGFGPLEGILLGVVFAALLGLVIGLFALRRSGIYFTMITMALSQMFFFFCLQAPFTHGEDGIQSIPRGRLFGLIDLESMTTLYIFVCIIFVIGMAAIWRFVNSPFGMILRAIRENEQRAISLGYSVQGYKLTAFVVSAALAGLAGATKVLVFQSATLTDVSWQTSGEVVLMTLMGGIGTLAGPVIGAGIIVTMQNYLAATGIPVSVMMGVVFVVFVLLFRRGVAGEFYTTRLARRLGLGGRP